MFLPRHRRGETISHALLSLSAWRDHLPGLALAAGVALTMLALVETARAAPPSRPALPAQAVPMTAGELKILTAGPATYRNRDSADPVSYTLRPDGSLTVFLEGGKEIHEGKWAIEANRFCVRIGWFYKNCSDAWKLGEASYFFWGEDEDDDSSLAHNTYDRVP